MNIKKENGSIVLGALFAIMIFVSLYLFTDIFNLKQPEAHSIVFNLTNGTETEPLDNVSSYYYGAVISDENGVLIPEPNCFDKEATAKIDIEVHDDAPENFEARGLSIYAIKAINGHFQVKASAPFYRVGYPVNIRTFCDKLEIFSE